MGKQAVFGQAYERQFNSVTKVYILIIELTRALKIFRKSLNMHSNSSHI